MPMSDRTRAMFARAKELRAQPRGCRVKTLATEFGVTVDYAGKVFRMVGVGPRTYLQRMASDQAARRGRKVAVVDAPGIVTTMSRVQDLRPIVAAHPRRIHVAYVMARYGVSVGYAMRLRQLAELPPAEADAKHESILNGVRQWVVAQGPDYAERKAEQHRAWTLANPGLVLESRRRSRGSGAATRVVRERGAVPVADPLHRRIAAMLPAGMPTVIADEIVAAAWLAASEGADLDEAIRIGRRSARGLMEFEFASLDAPIASDPGRTMLDLVEDGAADDEDSILDRLDREREWRRAA